MTEAITAAFSYLQQTAKNLWYWNRSPQDEESNGPQPSRENEVKGMHRKEPKAERKKKKGKAVKKKGETPSAPPAEVCRQTAQNRHEASKNTPPFMGSSTKIQSDNASPAEKAAFNATKNHVRNSTVHPGRQLPQNSEYVDEDSDNDDEGKNTEGTINFWFQEESDDEDDCEQEKENRFERKAESVTEANNKYQTWFEKSEKDSTTNSYTAMNTRDIKLSEKQAKKFREAGQNRKVYAEWAENPESLLKNEPTKYKRCQLRIESPQRSVATVLDKRNKYSEIVIDGRSKAGRTYTGDEVVVEVLSEPRKNRGTSHRAKEAFRTHVAQTTEERAYGKVVGLLKRTNFANIDYPVVYCKLDRANGFLMRPLCGTVPKIHVMNDLVKREYPHLTKSKIEIKKITPDGDLVHEDFFDVHPDNRERCVFEVVILAWKLSCHYPLGAVLAKHEYGSDYSSGLEVLIMQHRVPKHFPKDVVHDTKNVSEETILEQRGGREDLTGDQVFTIDDADSKDLDDAISIKKEGSHYIVGVHISDVASIVKENSSIDLEARRRAVTFYPSNRQSHPMLPEPLSHHFCSLLPHEERLTLSMFFKFDEGGSRVQEPADLKKSVIKSCRQLTYEKVQMIIDGESPPDIEEHLLNAICILHSITTKLRKTRKGDSVMSIPFADPRLPDLKKVTKNIQAHALVEELMILTNSCIASRLSEDKTLRDIMLVRCQKAPTMEQLQEWRNREGEAANLVMQLQSKKVSPESRLTFREDRRSFSQNNIVIQKSVWQKLRRHLEQGEKEEAQILVFTDDLHPVQFFAIKHWMDLMERAEYKCHHGLNKPELLHFDLDREVYTTCTSPIRRYADLHVQRVLHALLDGQHASCLPESVTELCQRINVAMSSQKAFQKGCKQLKMAEGLSNQPLVFRAYAEEVDKEGLTVCIPSLSQLSDGKQKLTFNMFGISCQPELKPGTAAQQDSVTVQWEKRMFQNALLRPEGVSNQQYSNKSGGRNTVIRIRPDQLSLSVKCEHWRGILETLSSGDQENLASLSVRENNGESGVDYVPFSDSCTPSQQPIQFQMTYTPGQILQLQMSAVPMSGTLKLRVDTLRVARNLELCIQHVKGPIPTLCSLAKNETRNLDFSTCKTFEAKCMKYLKSWIPLIEMEAAMNSGRSQNGVVVENVNITMEELSSHKNKPYSGSFRLSAKFCRDQGIEFGGKSVDSCGQNELKTSGKFAIDFLCLRYRCPCSETVQSWIKQSTMSVAVDKHYTWLAHGSVVNVVHKKRKAGDLWVVNFALSPASPRPPAQLMTKHGASLTVEILPKLDVDRRAQEMLYQLKDPVHTLPRAIAMGLALPPLDGDYEEAIQKIVQSPSDLEVTGTGGWRPLPKNNPCQKDAIRKALTNSLTLIRGPPGTGKTNTGIKLVYHFCEVNRRLKAEGRGKRTVMYCGPSNKSVDLVARELKAKLGPECPKIVRVYGALIENQDYPVPGRDFVASKDAQGLQSDPTLRDISLHHVIRQKGKPHATELQNFDEKFRRCIAYPSRFGVDPQDVRDYRKILFRASKEELQQHECILTTCAMGASQRLVEWTSSSKEEKSSVFQILIDECGMCTEPGAMAPILATHAKQVVLIGDHQQLRPIVVSQQAAELGLDQSLFERLHRDVPDIAVFLKDQYRMHPEICAFPSGEFYGGKLDTKAPGRKSQAHTWNVDPLPFWPRQVKVPPLPPYSGSDYDKLLQRVKQTVPHLLVDVQGVEKTLTVTTEEGNEKSRSNDAEADKVVEVLDYLKEVHHVDLNRVKVLTQYKAQRHLLVEKVARVHKNRFSSNALGAGCAQRLSHDPQLVGTVVSSQGDEWDYVILSTVRSLPPHKIEATPTDGWCRQNLGFIIDRNQINVALTRARRGLIIVGNRELLRCDEVWRRLVERYECLGCIRQASQFPPRQGSDPTK